MENYSIFDYFAILRRRRPTFFITTAIFLMFAVIFVSTWSRYQSVATIQLKEADIPQGMTSPLGMTPTQMLQALATQRIEQIEGKVTSTSSLVDIITKFDLYPKERKSQAIVDIVEKMRKKIKLQLVTSDLSSSSGVANPTSSAAQSDGAITFSIGFTYSEPLAAQHVTNELVSRFLDEDLRERRGQAKATTSLIDAQIESLDQSMAAQEKKISDFKVKHPSVRPETLLLNQQQIQMIQINIAQADTQTQTLEKAKGDLLTQLVSTEPYSRVMADGQMLTTPSVQLKTLQSKYTAISGQYGPDHPDVVKLRHQIEALQAETGQSNNSAVLQVQINDTKASLAAAEKTYGPDHPDVTALKAQLASLQKQLAGSNGGSGSSNSELKKDADNPAYLMLMTQLNSVTEQLNGARRQRESLDRQLQQYQLAVAQTPVVEQELASLSRDYDNGQLRLRELQEKKLTADMNEQMEQGRTSERLEVVNPPELPTHTHPAQVLLGLAGVMASVMAGFGGIVVAELLSRNVHGARHLESVTGMLPLVVISHIYTLEERRQIRKSRIRASVAAAVLVVVALIVIDQAIIPLDVLFSVVGNRVGKS